MRTLLPFCILLLFSAYVPRLNAQEVHDGHADRSGVSAQTHADGDACGSHDSDEDAAFNPGDLALHHIADANAVHIFGDLYLPLPMMLYAPGQGWTLTTSAAFKPHHHGNGTVSRDGYVLVHGNVMRVRDYVNFPKGTVEVSEPTHNVVEVNGKPKTIYYVKAGGTCFDLEPKSTLDGGFMGGGLTSFYDFSVTRNVFTMLLACGLLFFLFRAVAKAYAVRDGQAPKGIQSLMEPLVTFIRDDVAKPNIGHHYERYMPYLLTVFFFILGLNLFGQVPFFPGSANVTGSLSVTLVLALITFLMTNLTANRNYWEHVLWMPGVPAALKVLIMTPVEVLGVFLKPFTLMLRLFANITAGHIVIISFVSLIFIFGKAGESVSGSIIGVAGAVPLTLFMMALELLVAFLQAYIFTMLSAVYFGMANEEAHH